MLKRCHFHVTSEKEKQDIINLINPRSITVIPNFVNLGPAPNSQLQIANSQAVAANCQLLTVNSELQTANPKPYTSDPKNSPFNLLFLSRIEEKKGLDILFRALKLVQIPWHFTIAGTGKADYILFLKSLAEELQLSDRITWIGHQDNDQKFSILAGHDLMILPSHDENFANVVIESLSVGTPVLISSNVGLADYVLVKDFGWVCSTGDNELALTIENAFADLIHRNEIRKNAPGQIRKDFDDECLTADYIEMYKKCVNRKEKTFMH